MALDFNQRSFTKTVDQAAIDEGLRAYMLKVYNYMTVGLLLTGFIAYFFGKASIVTNELGQIVGVTQVGALLFGSPLKWLVMLGPLGFVFYLGASAIMKGFKAKVENKNNELEENEAIKTSSNNEQLSNEITKLNELLKSDIITQEEFEKAKKKILED